MAADSRSADGVLHERHEMSDAQIGVSRFWFDACDQPGAGRQLLRRGVQPHSSLNSGPCVRSVERHCAPRVCQRRRSRGCACASGVARARTASRLARPQTSAALRPAGLTKTVEVSLLGSIRVEMRPCRSTVSPHSKERYAARTSEHRRRAGQRRDDARLLSVSDSVRDPRSRVRHGGAH
jgi:hypothetical protein